MHGLGKTDVLAGQWMRCHGADSPNHRGPGQHRVGWQCNQNLRPVGLYSPRLVAASASESFRPRRRRVRQVALTSSNPVPKST